MPYRDDSWDDYWKIRQLQGEINQLKYEKYKREYWDKKGGNKRKNKRLIRLSTIIKFMLFILFTGVIFSVAIHVHVIQGPEILMNNNLFVILHNKVGEFISPIINIVDLNKFMI